MIRYVEKGDGLHRAIAAANLSLYQRDGVWLSRDDPATVQAFIDSYDLDGAVTRQALLARIAAQAEIALAALTSRYPQGEVDSWPAQCQEARAWLADNSTPTPLLDAIDGGQDRAAFCQTVLDKSQAHGVACGAVIAWRRTLGRWLNEQLPDDLYRFEPQYPELPYAP